MNAEDPAGAGACTTDGFWSVATVFCTVVARALAGAPGRGATQDAVVAEVAGPAGGLLRAVVDGGRSAAITVTRSVPVPDGARPVPTLQSSVTSGKVVICIDTATGSPLQLLQRSVQALVTVVAHMDEARLHWLAEADEPVVLCGGDAAAFQAASAWWPVSVYDQDLARSVAVAIC